ncbi:type I pullulanase [Bacillus sp. ISL-35]|uniref:type I pullulanase n=1 Tax=Bacillus sp. ISL-35 TaxID=2819122 RepID=UPI001BEC2766|nr:type I pullulanase [Bacillus sp. ISL-35]MBT2680741.1 type I pullulanase [Bacillus sp. ISL-35]MBT2705550.1 type I pullulanase [Chryseobacterium sp. ISL-80]
MIAIKREFYAYLDQVDLITVLLPYSYFDGDANEFRLKGEGVDLPLAIQEKVYLEETVKYICLTSIRPEIGKPYKVSDNHGGETDLQIGAVIRTEEFDRLFFYEGKDLGVSYTPERSTFKLWAPTAGKIRLKLFREDQHNPEFINMKRTGKGVWSISVDRDLELYRYSFLVCINLEWREAVDPYAIALTINGEYGVVVDRAKTSEVQESFTPLRNPVDAIIYEAHIRDLTMHPNSGASKNGTYLGAAEMDTKTPMGESTGISYIRQLGVTHIELLPFHDYEGVDERDIFSSYNWGYNPVHYNVPDGSYATDPEDPYNRITELKQLISAAHKMGLGVIMDVVYNHVYIREDSPFEKIVPGYYFRHDEHGLPSNGTGVGNDIASERLMVRKYIVDSVLYWLNEYQVDGFRFDLMGILDVETMTAVRKAVDSVNPHILIIGEGWDLNTPLPVDRKANIANQAKLQGIGQFNDWFRDSIKGSTFNIYDKGYALGNERYLEAAKQVMAGSIGIGKRKNGLFLQPVQSVNYIESHDNHTLWDKLKISTPDVDDAILKKQHRLATSMVLLAQGIPFLHSGQEFFRTKKGVGNSYRSPDDINWLDWDLRDENLDNVNYIKGIIAIRKANEAFRLGDSEEIRRRMAFLPLQAPLIGYELQAGTGWEKILVLINPSMDQQLAELPEEAKWNVLADHENASAQPFRHMEGNKVLLEPCSLSVVAK